MDWKKISYNVYSHGCILWDNKSLCFVRFDGNGMKKQSLLKNERFYSSNSSRIENVLPIDENFWLICLKNSFKSYYLIHLDEKITEILLCFNDETVCARNSRHYMVFIVKKRKEKTIYWISKESIISTGLIEWKNSPFVKRIGNRKTRSVLNEYETLYVIDSTKMTIYKKVGSKIQTSYYCIPAIRGHKFELIYAFGFIYLIDYYLDWNLYRFEENKDIAWSCIRNNLRMSSSRDSLWIYNKVMNTIFSKSEGE